MTLTRLGKAEEGMRGEEGEREGGDINIVSAHEQVCAWHAHKWVADITYTNSSILSEMGVIEIQAKGIGKVLYQYTVTL